MSSTKSPKPSHTYTSLDKAYDHFNRRLFGGRLPACLITLQRHKGAYGYFSHERFAHLGNGDTTDEIALNPATFAGKSPAWILSVLVHEMVHLRQFHFGKPSRAGYHNAEWASMMAEVGLEPMAADGSGKTTGQKMCHEIVAGGRFDVVCAEFLAAGHVVLYRDRAEDGEQQEKRQKKAASKTKYTCPGCDLNAWAKPGAHLLCGDCELELEPEEPAEDAGD
jgi:predicted SprT family Zn-dependent metalloprotease